MKVEERIFQNKFILQTILFPFIIDISLIIILFVLIGNQFYNHYIKLLLLAIIFIPIIILINFIFLKMKFKLEYRKTFHFLLLNFFKPYNNIQNNLKLSLMIDLLKPNFFLNSSNKLVKESFLFKVKNTAFIFKLEEENGKYNNIINLKI